MTTQETASMPRTGLAQMPKYLVPVLVYGTLAAAQILIAVIRGEPLPPLPLYPFSF